MSTNPQACVNSSRTKLEVQQHASASQRPFHITSRRRGCMVVLLGPDGSGKSSVLAGLIEQLRKEQIPVRAFHYRPQCRLDGSPSQPVTDPHGQAPRNWLQSMLKLVLLLLRFNVGYVREVRTHLRQGGIVLFDRYYHDMLVDPCRYRYGGPKWLARVAGRFVPQPDLWVVLDAPVEVLRQRKQEVPMEETWRQRYTYLQFATSHKNVQVIEASMPLPHVIKAVRKIIAKH